MTSSNRKGMQTHDTIESFREESDLFYSIRYHQSPFASPAKAIIRDPKGPTDHLSKKLELKAVNQLLKGRGGLAFLGPVCKYTFLGLIFPPYFILYRMPVWAIRNVWQSVVRGMTEAAFKCRTIGRHLASPFFKGKTFIKEGIKQFIRPINPRPNSRSKSDLFRSFWTHAKKLCMRPSGLFASYLKRTSRGIASAYLAFESSLRNRFETLEERILNALKRPFLIFYKLLTASAENLRKQLAEGKRSLVSIKSVAIDQPVSTLYRNLLKIWNLDLAKAPGFDFSKRILYYHIGRFLEVKSRKLPLRPKTKFSISFGINALLQKGEQWKGQAAAQYLKAYNSFVPALRRHYNILTGRALSMAAKTPGIVFKSLGIKLNRSSIKSYVRKLAAERKIKTSVLLPFNTMRDKARVFAARARAGYLRAIYLGRGLAVKIRTRKSMLPPKRKELARSPGRMIRYGFHAAYQKGCKGIDSCRLLWIWSKVLLRYGMEQVRETASSLLKQSHLN